MATGNPLSEARHLFSSLAKIEQLLRQAEAENEPSLWTQALELVDKHTYNKRWHDEIASRCEASWRTTHDEGLHLTFDADSASPIPIEQARESGDPILLGNMFVRYGLYRDALMAYNSSEHRLECVSNLNILQGNWSMVQSNLGKTAALDTLGNTLCLNLAAAHWSTGHLGDALAVLLRLDPARAVSSAWLSETQVFGMLLVSALLSFDRNTLRYFARADPVYMSLNKESSRLVEALLQVDLPLFWSETALLSLPVVSPDLPPHEHPLELLRDRIRKDWLYVHNKLHLSTVLEAFQIGQKSDYSLIELLEDLRRWEAPYRVRPIEGTVEVFEPEADNASAAEELARWFKRDMLILHHQGSAKSYYAPGGLPTLSARVLQ